MSKLYLKWKRLFLGVILISILFGILLGFFCIKQGTNPAAFLRSFWVGRKAPVSPAKVVAEYLNAWEDLQPQKMYQLLSKTEREMIPEEKYIKDFQEFPLRPIEHKVLATRTIGNKAVVRVLVSWPSLDPEPLLKEEKLVLMLEDDKWTLSEQESFQ